MQIGCLGDIIFRANSDVVGTAHNITWSGSVRFSEHQRHLNNALTEFAGLNADRFSFDMTLMSELGLDVMAVLVKIWGYERSWEPLTLVFGDKAYGKHRWTIESHRIKMRYFDCVGNLSVAEVSISLVEYVAF